jgi:DNA polymerase III alpha subunit
LKTYYPTEFFCALLTSSANKSDKDLNLQIDSLKKEYPDLEILSPEINRSRKTYYPIGDLKILAPLVSIKGIGRKVSDTIVEAREQVGYFSSLDHFFRTVNSGGKTMIASSIGEHLINENVFSIFGSIEELKLQMKRYYQIKKMVGSSKKITESYTSDTMKPLF